MTSVIEVKEGDMEAFKEAGETIKKSGKAVVEVRSDGENVHLLIR